MRNKTYLSPFTNAIGTAKLVSIFSMCLIIVTMLKIEKTTNQIHKFM